MKVTAASDKAHETLIKNRPKLSLSPTQCKSDYFESTVLDAR